MKAEVTYNLCECESLSQLQFFSSSPFAAMTAKALFHKETLCKREEVQRFLSSLVLKPPEVGHLINCFHMAKTNSDTRNKKANVAAASTNLSKKGAKDGGPPRKVVTFSAIENFAYQTWRDFSDVRYASSAVVSYVSITFIFNPLVLIRSQGQVTQEKH